MSMSFMREGQVQSGQLEGIDQRVAVFKYKSNPLRNEKKKNDQH
jgi:hypothetical protein